MSTGLERGKNKTKAHQFHQEREIMSQQNNHDFWPQVEKNHFKKKQTFSHNEYNHGGFSCALKKD